MMFWTFASLNSVPSTELYFVTSRSQSYFSSRDSIYTCTFPNPKSQIPKPANWVPSSWGTSPSSTTPPTTPLALCFSDQRRRTTWSPPATATATACCSWHAAAETSTRSSTCTAQLGPWTPPRLPPPTQDLSSLKPLRFRSRVLWLVGIRKQRKGACIYKRGTEVGELGRWRLAGYRFWVSISTKQGASCFGFRLAQTGGFCPQRRKHRASNGDPGTTHLANLANPCLSMAVDQLLMVGTRVPE